MPRFTKPIPVDGWRDALHRVAKRIGTRNFSIVYRFYSTRAGIPFYVGRSDNPWGRESAHWRALRKYRKHRQLRCRVSFVDFAIFRGRQRRRLAYEQELRSFYYDENDLVNQNRPAVPEYWLYPRRRPSKRHSLKKYRR